MGSAVKTIGPYQATGGFVMRAWAKANEDTLVKYLQAYVEGVRWSLDPKNKDKAVGCCRSGSSCRGCGGAVLCDRDRCGERLDKDARSTSKASAMC